MHEYEIFHKNSLLKITHKYLLLNRLYTFHNCRFIRLPKYEYEICHKNFLLKINEYGISKKIPYSKTVMNLQFLSDFDYSLIVDSMIQIVHSLLNRPTVNEPCYVWVKSGPSTTTGAWALVQKWQNHIGRL